MPFLIGRWILNYGIAKKIFVLAGYTTSPVIQEQNPIAQSHPGFVRPESRQPGCSPNPSAGIEQLDFASNMSSTMKKDYVEQRDSGYWISGTRISLDSIVHTYQRGAAPESIQRAFPLTTLEEIYGAITFYLAHQQEVDTYLAHTETALNAQAQALNTVVREANPDLFQRLNQARHAREAANENSLPS